MNEKVSQKENREQEVANIEAALDWVMSKSKDGLSCPFCGWRAITEGKEEPHKLRSHLSNQHTFKVIQAYATGNMDASPVGDNGDKDNIMEQLGLEVQDELDTFDFLRVPSALKRKVTSDGSNLRWVTPQNAQRYKDAGMEFVSQTDLTDSEREALNLHHGTSDGHVKSNELTLMRIPPRLRDRLARVREAQQVDVGAARKEDFERRIEGVQRQVHDTLRKAGYDSTQAGNVARAVAKRAEGRISVTRGRG